MKKEDIIAQLINMINTNQYQYFPYGFPIQLHFSKGLQLQCIN